MNALSRIRDEILADKRKAAILGLLGVVSIGLGLRTFVFSDKKSPSRRTATVSPASLSPVGAKDTGQDSVSAVDAERRVREAMNAWTLKRTRLPESRDLFSLDNAHFPDPSQADRRASEGAKSAGIYDDDGVGASAIAGALERIRLKSTMIGSRTIAIFDLSALKGPPAVVARVGDAVGGFRITRITARSVTLERDGLTSELRVVDPLDD